MVQQLGAGQGGTASFSTLARVRAMIECRGTEWIELATLIFAAATFLVAFLTLYRMVSKPRVRVYFWDQSTNKRLKEIILTAGEMVTLRLLFRNEGDLLRLWKPAATMLTAFIYFPENFKIKEARRYEAQDVKSNKVFQASPSGRFARRKYIAVPSAYPEIRPPAISIVSYDEDVICEVDITIPRAEAGKRDNIYCQVSSREGDLGVQKLTTQVE